MVFRKPKFKGYNWVFKASFLLAFTGIASVLVMILQSRALWSLNAERQPAAINRAAMALSKPSSLFYGHSGKEISPDLVAAYNISQVQKKDFETDKFIPVSMQPTDDSRKVMIQIADQTLSTWTNSEQFKSSRIGKVSQEVEENLSQEVVIPSANKVDHKIGFTLQAFQATAQVRYSGFTNADFKYNLASHVINAEISEPISNANELVLNHEVGSEENISRLLMRWSF